MRPTGRMLPRLFFLFFFDCLPIIIIILDRPREQEHCLLACFHVVYAVYDYYGFGHWGCFSFFFFFLLFPCYVSPPSFPPSSSFHARIFTFSSAFSVRAALLACLLLFAHIKSVIPPRWRWGRGVVGFCFVLFCYFLFESQEGREEEAGWLVGCHRQNSGGEGCFCWTCLRFFSFSFVFSHSTCGFSLETLGRTEEPERIKAV